MISVGKIEFRQKEFSIQIEITKEIILKLIQHSTYTTTRKNITVELLLDKLQPKEIEKIINDYLKDKKACCPTS